MNCPYALKICSSDCVAFQQGEFSCKIINAAINTATNLKRINDTLGDIRECLKK